MVAVGPETGPKIFVTCPGDNQIRETNLAGELVNEFGQDELQILGEWCPGVEGYGPRILEKGR